MKDNVVLDIFELSMSAIFLHYWHFPKEIFSLTCVIIFILIAIMSCKNWKNMDKMNKHCDDNDIVGGNQCLCR